MTRFQELLFDRLVPMNGAKVKTFSAARFICGGNVCYLTAQGTVSPYSADGIRSGLALSAARPGEHLDILLEGPCGLIREHHGLFAGLVPGESLINGDDDPIPIGFAMTPCTLWVQGLDQ